MAVGGLQAGRYRLECLCPRPIGGAAAAKEPGGGGWLLDGWLGWLSGGAPAAVGCHCGNAIGKPGVHRWRYPLLLGHGLEGGLRQAGVTDTRHRVRGHLDHLRPAAARSDRRGSPRQSARALFRKPISRLCGGRPRSRSPAQPLSHHLRSRGSAGDGGDPQTVRRPLRCPRRHGVGRLGSRASAGRPSLDVAIWARPGPRVGVSARPPNSGGFSSARVSVDLLRHGQLRRRRTMDEKRLRTAIGQLLDSQPDNQRLRDNLEGLCRDPAFAGLTWFWGPRLYARSKATFRPLILNHFSEWLTSGNRWRRVAWADHAADLEGWLVAARAGRDGALVRRLLRWKYAARKGWGIDRERWNLALTEAYRSAPSPAARALVLDEFDDWFQLDEPTAIRLYETDRHAAPFILKHLPILGWGRRKRVMWEKLGALARQEGDEALFFALYRRLMPVERWETEVLTLADAVVEQAELNRVLENRHLEGYGFERGPTVLKLLQRRGRDVLPYVRAKLQETLGGWGKDEQSQQFVDLAERKGWWDLWSASLRAARNAKLFNASVGKLMREQALSEEVRRERLQALAGTSREWNWPGLGLAIIHHLDDDIACLVYARYPDLLRGPLRANVTPTWW